MEKNIIWINKRVVEKTKVVEVTGDIIVPDIKPDIVNIINTNGNAYIYKEDISHGRVRVDGNIDTYVVYLSENGETRSMETTISFTQSIEDENIVENMVSKQKVTVESIETKVLNERKITIRSILKIKTEFYERKEIEILEQLGEMKNVERLKESLKVKSVIGMNRNKTSIKEDIKIDNNIQIAEILKTNIEICNIENKISYNKVLAKADAKIKVIFLAEDGQMGVVESTIPIMSFIDIENVTENHICNVDYIIRNMLFKPNAKEMHSISCQVDFEVYCEAYESKNIEIIQDMFGTKEEIIFSRKEAEVQINETIRKEFISINEKIILEDINSILDVECRPVILNSNKSGNFTNYEGELDLLFYYEADNRNGLNVKNIKIPFITKSEISENEIEITVENKNFSVNNENVDCEIKLIVKQNSVNYKKISMIENIESQKYTEEDDYKMYIYFVKAGDTIWKIAKKFKVCMEEIIKINNLENPNKLNIGDRLYIMK